MTDSNNNSGGSAGRKPGEAGGRGKEWWRDDAALLTAFPDLECVPGSRDQFYCRLCDDTGRRRDAGGHVRQPGHMARRDGGRRVGGPDVSMGCSGRSFCVCSAVFNEYLLQEIHSARLLMRGHIASPLTPSQLPPGAVAQRRTADSTIAADAAVEPEDPAVESTGAGSAAKAAPEQAPDAEIAETGEAEALGEEDNTTPLSAVPYARPATNEAGARCAECEEEKRGESDDEAEYPPDFDRQNEWETSDDEGDLVRGSYLCDEVASPRMSTPKTGRCTPSVNVKS